MKIDKNFPNSNAALTHRSAKKSETTLLVSHVAPKSAKVVVTSSYRSLPPVMRGGNEKPAPRQQQRAFTLIELLLVLVILGILAAIVVPKFAGRTEQARQTAAQSQIA